MVGAVVVVVVGPGGLGSVEHGFVTAAMEMVSFKVVIYGFVNKIVA